ncbi:Males-absent on the first protein [Wickerhamiella sorbophila]|uniref:histone acetyltransferase n=1 Tax=Wickerhamiella sorbophila TaxID=45607 RepID=A0A2T0FIC2_9ASCO|nr:Males-absent on the first protein [Wickerhamiella sorbophila]PRT54754.1 Males-absent on the first protein [Wickerhamiella sorbophila]
MIQFVHYGPHKIKPWYESRGYIDLESKSSKSYRCKEPKSLWQGVLDSEQKVDPTREIDIWICPKCFLYTSVGTDIDSHSAFCRYKDSERPGRKVYDTESCSIYELDPSRSESEKLYMQCLSLFGKFFLETKSICFAMDGFLIYEVVDKTSGLVAGFFSKERHPWFNYNLACIVTFPPFQRRGLGQLMIGFSYRLTREQGEVGSPELPLSAHGEKTYLAYWCGEIYRVFLSEEAGNMHSLRELAMLTGIEPSDVVAAFQHMGAISKVKGRTSVDVDKIFDYATSHRLPPAFDESGIV